MLECLVEAYRWSSLFWRSAKDRKGRHYYYHMLTREVLWELKEEVLYDQMPGRVLSFLEANFRESFEQRDRQSLQHFTKSYNSYIYLSAQRGRVKDAIQTFVRMQQLAVPLDVTSLDALVRAMSVAIQRSDGGGLSFERVDQALRLMDAEKAIPSPQTCMQLMKACQRCRSMERVHDVFIRLQTSCLRKEMEIPLEGWLNVLEALISSDCDEEALSLFNRMRGSAESMRSNGKLLHVQTASGTRTRIPPADLTCYNAVIRGFARRGDLEAAHRIFSLITSDGLAPDDDSFCFLELCQR
mmetsp:Transcript_49936/g.156306  ORF Transcript_49936/g.156306 Transcript_49936/m.156306 type:complete len:298 (-) Transcript_49936:303-1196(-)